MTPAQLIALAERCEAAEGPDRELDLHIAKALGWNGVPNPTFAGGLAGCWYRPDGSMSGHDGPPRWTASLDAALMLVPDGSSWNMRWWSGDKRCCVTFYPPGDAPDDYFYIWEASTPALALAAASLRARAGELE